MSVGNVFEMCFVEEEIQVEMRQGRALICRAGTDTWGETAEGETAAALTGAVSITVVVYVLGTTKRAGSGSPLAICVSVIVDELPSESLVSISKVACKSGLYHVSWVALSSFALFTPAGISNRCRDPFAVYPLIVRVPISSGGPAGTAPMGTPVAGMSGTAATACLRTTAALAAGTMQMDRLFGTSWISMLEVPMGWDVALGSMRTSRRVDPAELRAMSVRRAMEAATPSGRLNVVVVNSWATNGTLVTVVWPPRFKVACVCATVGSAMHRNNTDETLRFISALQWSVSGLYSRNQEFFDRRKHSTKSF